LNWLRKRHGSSEFTDRLNVHRGADFESWQEMGMVIAGSPETVHAEIARQSELLGINYLVAYLFFGTMTLADAMRSQQLFATEVMPKLADI
jgi:alkanesulfonate monooxygenase SsuD/methylene tetrahydromethanopterin reductase-like flavin-dependent oxidoreductase (luciferase family)